MENKVAMDIVSFNCDEEGALLDKNIRLDLASKKVTDTKTQNTTTNPQLDPPPLCLHRSPYAVGVSGEPGNCLCQKLSSGRSRAPWHNDTSTRNTQNTKYKYTSYK